MRALDYPHAGPFALGLVLVALTGCDTSTPASRVTTGAAPSGTRAPAAPPSPYTYPPPVKGHYEEVNTGTFDLTDGIAYLASGGGTVVYVTEKAIASPVLTASTCPMTQARALTLLRNAAFLEVTLDAAGRSGYFAGGTPYGGRGREEDVGGGYWKIALNEPGEGRIAGSVSYKRRGGFEFDLPVAKPGVSEVSEGDRVKGSRFDQTRRAPSEAEVAAAYTALRRAALAKDLKAMLSAQGFDAKQVEAIRGLPGIEADLQAHADRFLDPGSPEEPSVAPGFGNIGGRGKNSKGAAFANYYEFAPCGEALVLVGIGENPQ